MITATLSSKNQITIPKFMLDLLTIASGDKLFVSTFDKTITLTPIKGTLVDSLAGSVKVPKSKMGIPFNKVREIVSKKVAYEIGNS